MKGAVGLMENPSVYVRFHLDEKGYTEGFFMGIAIKNTLY